MRETRPRVLQRTFPVDEDVVVVDLDDAEAIIDVADDEVELLLRLRALNAMVPVPKMRRTRERRPDAEDDVAKRGVGGREKEEDEERKTKG